MNTNIQRLGIELILKKYDDVTNLFTYAISIINIALSFLFDYWLPLFLPILVILASFYIVMRVIISCEEDLGKSYRFRMILWFGLTCLMIAPPLFFVTINGIIWLRGPVELPDFPVPSGSIYGPLTALLLIPLALTIIVPSFVAEKIGKNIVRATLNVDQHIHNEFDRYRSFFKLRTLLTFKNQRSGGLILVVSILTFNYGFLSYSYYSSLNTSGNIDAFLRFLPLYTTLLPIWVGILAQSILVMSAVRKGWSEMKVFATSVLTLLVSFIFCFLLIWFWLPLFL